MRSGVLSRVVGVPRIVYDSGFIDTSVQEINITGLDLASDGGYELLFYRRNAYSGSADCLGYVNGDQTAKYGVNELWGYYNDNQIHQNPPTPVITTAQGFATEGMPVQWYAQFSHSSYDLVTHGNGNKSVAMITKFVNSVSGASVNGSVGWKTNAYMTGSPSGNMTSLQLISNRVSGIGVGSRVILIAKGKPAIPSTRIGMLRPNKITGVWKRIAGYNGRAPTGDGDNAFTWQAKSASASQTPVEEVALNTVGTWSTEDIDGWAQGGIYKLRHHGGITNGPISSVFLRFGSTAGTIDTAANYGYRTMASNALNKNTATSSDTTGIPITEEVSVMLGEVYILVPPAGMGEVVVLSDGKGYVNSGASKTCT